MVIVVAMVVFLHGLIYPNTSQQEGFMPTTVILSNRRCGVDLPSCLEGEQCINGYCASTVPPKLLDVTDLPVRPPAFSPDPWAKMNIPVDGHNESLNA
ncbi:hypothetical protein EB118_18100 [bacterium]|nr:hypothetical protein [bacterium]